MRNVAKRLERLEASRTSTRRPTERSAIIMRGLRHLTLAQLLLLEQVAAERENGTLRRPLTPDEAAAEEAGLRAVDLEFRRAGLDSRA
jgi:hypothetical protein